MQWRVNDVISLSSTEYATDMAIILLPIESLEIASHPYSNGWPWDETTGGVKEWHIRILISLEMIP